MVSGIFLVLKGVSAKLSADLNRKRKIVQSVWLRSKSYVNERSERLAALQFSAAHLLTARRRGMPRLAKAHKELTYCSKLAVDAFNQAVLDKYSQQSGSRSIMHRA